MKCPYPVTYLNSTKKTLAIICKFCGKETHISLIFKSFKVSEFFSCKAKIREYLRSSVVHEFVCAGCNVRFVGEIHVKTRINKNLHTDRRSHVFQNVAGNDSSKSGYNESCFKVLNMHRLQIHIKWEKLTLNG